MSAKQLIVSKSLPFLIITLLLSSCASHNMQQETQIKEQSQSETIVKKKAPASAGEPAQELSGELLYDLLLAEIAVQRGDYDLAFKKYYAAAKATRDSRLAKKATRVTLFSKNDAQTFKSVKLWSQIQPDNIDVQQIYASSLISQKQDQQAIEHLKKILQLSDDVDSGLKRIVSIINTIDEKQRAQQIFNQATIDYQDNNLVILYQAKIAYKFVDYAKTAQYLDKLLALEPDNQEALIVKVELLKKQKQDQQAIEILQKLVHQSADNIVLRLELARLLVKNKYYDRADKQIQVLAKNELSPDVLFTISLLAIEMDKTDDAKAYLLRLYAHRHYASEAAYFIARLESGRKDYPEAEKWFKRVTKGKYTFEAYLGLVLTYAHQEKFEQALALLEHSRGSNSKQGAEILQIKAEVYLQAKNYSKAYDVYTEALSSAPDNHDIRYGRAMLADKMGRLDLFEQDLHIILAEDPKDNQALNALGYVLADKTNRYQEALQYIERALAINPDDVATLDSMGWVLYKMGEQTRAISYLQRAYEHDSDAEIAAHYGEVLWVTGQTKKAKKIWNKALQNEPEHQVLIGIMSQYLNQTE